jgi:hypothetical protein
METNRVVRLPLLPYSVDNWLKDGSEVVSLMYRLPFMPRKVLGTNLCQRLSQSQGHNAAGRISSIEKSNGLIRNQTQDLPAYSIVLQPNKLLHVPVTNGCSLNSVL